MLSTENSIKDKEATDASHNILYKNIERLK